MSYFGLLKELIKINTHSGNIAGISKSYALILRWIKTNNLHKHLRVKLEQEQGVPPMLIINPPARYIDPACKIDVDTPHILLATHIDTVYKSHWLPKRFEDKTWIYGPGAVDMKASIVCALYALKNLAKRNPSFLQNVTLVISPDEEIGMPFYKEVRRSLYSQFNVAFVLEAVPKDKKIVVMRKGIFQAKIITFGQDGHAGNHAFVRKNAIDKLITHLTNIKRRFHSKETNTSVNIGVIKGGIAPNVIAKRAYATVDIRSFSPTVMQKAKRYVLDLDATADTKVEPLTELPIWLLPKGKRRRQFVKALQVILPLWAHFYRYGVTYKYGGSEANLIAQYCPVVFDGFGPPGQNAHSKRERVLKKGIEDHINLLVEVIRGILEG